MTPTNPADGLVRSLASLSTFQEGVDGQPCGCAVVLIGCWGSIPACLGPWPEATQHLEHSSIRPYRVGRNLTPGSSCVLVGVSRARRLPRDQNMSANIVRGTQSMVTRRHARFDDPSVSHLTWHAGVRATGILNECSRCLHPGTVGPGLYIYGRQRQGEIRTYSNNHRDTLPSQILRPDSYQ